MTKPETTLKVLMNLERPDAGTAEILGLDTTRRGPEARAQDGYVPERTDHGYRWMTCARSVIMSQPWSMACAC